MERKVGIVGAREFPVVHAGPALFEWLAGKFPIATTTIYTRGSRGFDDYLGEGARYMGYTVIELRGTGGAANYIRDAQLVTAVEEVHAFFAPDHLGEGGTQHVIDKALDARKPSYSYTYLPGRPGAIDLIGSDDGEGFFDEGPGGDAGETQAAGEAASERAEQVRRGAPGWAENIGDLPF